jgi:hypothetical protein
LGHGHRAVRGILDVSPTVAVGARHEFEQVTLAIDMGHLRVLKESLLELIDIAIVEGISVKLNDSNNAR